MNIFNPERNVVEQLEEKFADRNLRFTTEFLGCVPVQAYGHIDGMRFYFRFRSNWGQLRVGPYDRELEELHALRVNEDKRARFVKSQAQYESGEISEGSYLFNQVLDGTDDPVVEETDDDFYPTRVVKNAACEGLNPEDIYNGYLTDEEAYNMFSQLVQNLVDVPEEQQVHSKTLDWLKNGRTINPESSQ